MSRSDAGRVDELATKLDRGEWLGAVELAEDLADTCDRNGALTVEPLPVADLLRSVGRVAMYVHAAQGGDRSSIEALIADVLAAQSSRALDDEADRREVAKALVQALAGYE